MKNNLILSSLLALFTGRFAYAAVEPQLLCGAETCGKTFVEKFQQDIIPMILLTSFILLVLVSSHLISRLVNKKLSWLIRILIIIFLLSGIAALYYN